MQRLACFWGSVMQSECHAMSLHAPMNRRQARKALMDGIKAGDIQAMAAVLDQMPDLVNAPNAHCHTPVGDAVLTGNCEVVGFLIERGGDGRGLVRNAAWMGDRAMADLLMEQGGILSGCDAAALGLVDRVRSDQVRERDGRQATPLHHAARHDQVAVIKMLLDSGAEMHAQDKHGHDALSYAVENKALGAARTLLDRGANVEAPGGHYGGRVLHRAILNRDGEMVALLLERGADVQRVDDRGKSPLLQAAVVGRKGIIELLLRYRPDRASALAYAKSRNRQALVDLLA